MKYLSFLGLFLLFSISCNRSNSEQSEKEITVTKKGAEDIPKWEDYKEEEIECIFDTSTYKFTINALKKYKPDINFKWDKVEKKAISNLPNGEILTLGIGGCDHFGYEAILITPIKFEEKDALIQKAKWLAKTFFANGFDIKYDQFISKGLYKEVKSDDTLNHKLFEIIDTDTEETNSVYNGFTFTRSGTSTKVQISGYQN
jgi:hypothetical protein